MKSLKLKDKEEQRYGNNQFTPCSLSKWQLSEECYRVATKAVSLNKSERYLTFAEFFNEWKVACEMFLEIYPEC